MLVYQRVCHGKTHQVTREWSDGVAAELIRNATRDNHNPETRRQYGHVYLVGGLEHFLFFHILGIITPTDFHIFQRG